MNEDALEDFIIRIMKKHDWDECEYSIKDKCSMFHKYREFARLLLREVQEPSRKAKPNPSG
jgi:hypothetical protein